MKNIFLTYLIAYLAGSVNFAIIFFKLAGKADPRLGFSGNAGTTNVYRQAGLFWAVIILLLDVGRALAVAAVALSWLPASFVCGAGFFLAFGNSFPCFHGWRGGKGVASYLGFTLLIAPWPALLAALIWVAVYGICRIPFIASFFMVFTLAAGLASSFNFAIPAVIGAAATFLLIIFRHQKNIIQYRQSKGAITPRK